MFDEALEVEKSGVFQVVLIFLHRNSFVTQIV